MKTLNIPLDDKDYKLLERLKYKLGLSWNEFLMFLLKNYKGGAKK